MKMRENKGGSNLNEDYFGVTKLRTKNTVTTLAKTRKVKDLDC
jgi:hypothetical protein